MHEIASRPFWPLKPFPNRSSAEAKLNKKNVRLKSKDAFYG